MSRCLLSHSPDPGPQTRCPQHFWAPTPEPPTPTSRGTTPGAGGTTPGTRGTTQGTRGATLGTGGTTQGTRGTTLSTRGTTQGTRGAFIHEIPCPTPTVPRNDRGPNRSDPRQHEGRHGGGPEGHRLPEAVPQEDVRPALPGFGLRRCGVG